MLFSINDLYEPAPHYATTKRFKFVSFPMIWNYYDIIKYNPGP
jgi:hypothetical protein